ncbi:MAG: DUF1641 domain-containing protein [Haloarculaceae archaeon]
MSESDLADPVAAAVEDNPEEVARLLRRLGLVNDLLDTVELATAALDDEMVQSLAANGDLLAESADGLATRETANLARSLGENADDLESALATLVRLERAGTLEDLADVADVASLATAALDDEMVQSLASTGGSLGELADAASDPDTRDGVETLLGAVGEASADPPERVGAIGLLRAIRDPEVQRGLGFVLGVARTTGRELGAKSE